MLVAEGMELTSHVFADIQICLSDEVHVLTLITKWEHHVQWQCHTSKLYCLEQNTGEGHHPQF